MSIPHNARVTVKISLTARRAGGGALAIQRDEASPGLPLDLGIYTGPVIVGTIGAAGRRDHTMVGDSVNVAVRLEPPTAPR